MIKAISSYFTNKYGFFVLLIVLLFMLSFFISKNYELLENRAQKNITNNCILYSIGWMLAGHFERHKAYPSDIEIVRDIIREAGYPSNLGCGLTSISQSDYIVDTFGNEFIYEYHGKNSVSIYFNDENSNGVKSLMVFELVKNHPSIKERTN